MSDTFCSGLLICITFLCITDNIYAGERRKLDPDTIAYFKKLRQQKPEENELFRSTYWMPNAGVKLLNDKSAQKVWGEFSSKESSCLSRDLKIDIDEQNNMPIGSYFVFQTKSVNIFVFERPMESQDGVRWVVCHRDNKEYILSTYHADPSRMFDPTQETEQIFGGCSEPVSVVRFRRYMKDGPLFLDVRARRCQDAANYHEVSFNITEEKFEVLPGSRLGADYLKIKSQPWRWYMGENHTPKKITYNNEGEAVWSRLLYKRPVNLITNRGDVPPLVKVRQDCKFNKVEKSIDCTYLLKEKALLKDYHHYHYTYTASDSSNIDCDYIERQFQDVEAYRTAGFIVRNRDIKKLKKFYKEECQNKKED